MLAHEPSKLSVRALRLVAKDVVTLLIPGGQLRLVVHLLLDGLPQTGHGLLDVRDKLCVVPPQAKNRASELQHIWVRLRVNELIRVELGCEAVHNVQARRKLAQRQESLESAPPAYLGSPSAAVGPPASQASCPHTPIRASSRRNASSTVVPASGPASPPSGCPQCAQVQTRIGELHRRGRAPGCQADSSSFQAPSASILPPAASGEAPLGRSHTCWPRTPGLLRLGLSWSRPSPRSARSIPRPSVAATPRRSWPPQAIGEPRGDAVASRAQQSQ
eukprot:scaffold367_cov254-Pinguiococcus_pyrenoidosus.AAC.12